MSEPVPTPPAEPTPAPAPEPTPAPAPEPTPAEPAAAPHWSEGVGLNPEIAQAPWIRQSPSLDDAFKRAQGAMKMVGGEKIAKPQPTWDEQAWALYDEATGVPAEVSGYEAPDLPAGFSPEVRDAMLDVFKQNHIPAEAGKALMEGYVQLQTAQQQKLDQQRETFLAESKQTLERELGMAYNESLQLANEILLDELGQEGYDAFSQIQLAGGGMLGDHPDVVRLLASIGNKMKREDAVRSGDAASNGAGRFHMTPAEAQKRIDDLMKPRSQEKDEWGQPKDWPWADENHPDHDEVMAEINRLGPYAVTDEDEQKFMPVTRRGEE